jgi:amidase
MGVRTAVETAAAVRSGELSPTDAVAVALGRIAAYEERLGAFQVVRAEHALAEAAQLAQRPDLAELALAGVPVAVKDNVAVAGEPMRDGSLATSDAPQAVDHPVVARLRAAGAVVVGITRTPELCIWAASDSPFGVAKNPWDVTRTPGGSSGGSAAAVAAGLVPVAHGNDGLGSIRIPGACCGLVGIKPGLGVVPADVGGNDWYSMAENGPLATTVADTALALSVMAGRPGYADVRPPDRPLRIGVSVRPPLPGATLDDGWADGVRRSADVLADLGHRVEEAEYPYPVNSLPALMRWFGGASFDADGLDRKALQRRTRTHVRLGDVVRRFDLVKEAQRTAWTARAEQWFRRYDVLLTPTLAAPPIAATEWGRRAWLASIVSNARYAPYAAPWNVVGWPGITVPAGVHPEAGTPVGVQLVSPPRGEVVLLGLAAQLEDRRPWLRVAPGYAA